jgi:hypothetical protein
MFQLLKATILYIRKSSLCLDGMPRINVKLIHDELFNTIIDPTQHLDAVCVCVCVCLCVFWVVLCMFVDVFLGSERIKMKYCDPDFFILFSSSLFFFVVVSKHINQVVEFCNLLLTRRGDYFSANIVTWFSPPVKIAGEVTHCWGSTTQKKKQKRKRANTFHIKNRG